MYQAPLVHARQAESRHPNHGTGAYNNEDAVGASVYSHSWERVLQLLSNTCTPISVVQCFGYTEQDIRP